MKYEIWQESDEETTVTTLIAHDNNQMRSLNGPAAKLISEFEADSWEDAMNEKRSIMGWVAQ